VNLHKIKLLKVRKIIEPLYKNLHTEELNIKSFKFEVWEVLNKALKEIDENTK